MIRDGDSYQVLRTATALVILRCPKDLAALVVRLDSSEYLRMTIARHSNSNFALTIPVISFTSDVVSLFP
jgi:hypothetical protein